MRSPSFAIPFVMLIIAFSLLVLFSPVLAASGDQNGVLPPGEIVDQDMYLNVPSVLIQGQIDGMLVAVAQEITIDSTAVIQNDSFLFAREVTIREGADLSGNLMIIAQTLNINGKIRRNLYGIGANLTVMPEAVIDNNLFFGGYQIQIEHGALIDGTLYAASYQTGFSGELGRNVYLFSSAVRLDGKIQGDAKLKIESSSINEDAIRFWLPYLENFGIQEPYSTPFEITDRATVTGELIVSGSSDVEKILQNAIPGIVQTPLAGEESIDPPKSPNTREESRLTTMLIRTIRLWVNLVLSAIVALLIFPTFFKISTLQVRQKPLAAAGIGLISLVSISIGLFVLAILLAFSAFLLGLVAMGSLGRLLLGLAVVSLLWVTMLFSLIVMYGSKLVVAYWLGRRILRQSVDYHRPADLPACVLGITIFVLLSAIPYLGWLISVLVTLIGLGAMWYVNQSQKWLPFLKWKA